MMERMKSPYTSIINTSNKFQNEQKANKTSNQHINKWPPGPRARGPGPRRTRYAGPGPGPPFEQVTSKHFFSESRFFL